MGERKLADLQRILGTHLPPELLRQALRHSSYANEHPGEGESNERLEFLGDAVLNLAVSEYLYRTCPHPEGELTQLRAAIVSGSALAEVARDLGLSSHLLLGRGEEESGGRERSSLLSDAFEALVGAVFLHEGYEAAARFVRHHLRSALDRARAGDVRRDYKTLLQEEAQRHGLRPVYTLLEARGADHAREFTVQVELNGRKALGKGRRIKDAEQEAARRLYLQILASDADLSPPPALP